MSFSTLVIANIGLILLNRSWRSNVIDCLKQHNPSLWWFIGAASAFLLLALTLALLHEILHFAAITLPQFFLCFVVGLVSVIWF